MLQFAFKTGSGKPVGRIFFGGWWNLVFSCGICLEVNILILSSFHDFTWENTAFIVMSFNKF